jgi:hypothetical protein
MDKPLTSFFYSCLTLIDFVQSVHKDHSIVTEVDQELLLVVGGFVLGSKEDCALMKVDEVVLSSVVSMGKTIKFHMGTHNLLYTILVLVKGIVEKSDEEFDLAESLLDFRVDSIDERL